MFFSTGKMLKILDVIPWVGSQPFPGIHLPGIEDTAKLGSPVGS